MAVLDPATATTIRNLIAVASAVAPLLPAGAAAELTAAPDARLAHTPQVTAGMYRSALAAIAAGNAALAAT